MVPPIVPMTEGSAGGNAYAAFGAAPPAPHSSANMYTESWTVPAGPTHQSSMYHASPQDWSYMETPAISSSNYMAQSQVYQNPYAATQWQAPQSAYMTNPTATHQSPYTSQISTSQPTVHNPFSPDQGVSSYNAGGVPLDISPATTTTSMSSNVATWPALVPPPEPTSDLPHVCVVRGCYRAYKRKAELDRHTQEKHGPTSGRLLCPVDMCPRGIPGEGFDRMSHLTQHLRSGKHRISAQQAKFMAREHNPRKGGRNA